MSKVGINVVFCLLDSKVTLIGGLGLNTTKVVNPIKVQLTQKGCEINIQGGVGH
jgi:hypothetical protein